MEIRSQCRCRREEAIGDVLCRDWHPPRSFTCLAAMHAPAVATTRSTPPPPPALRYPPRLHQRVLGDFATASERQGRRGIQGSVAIWLVARQVESLFGESLPQRVYWSGSQQHLYPHNCSHLPPTSLKCSCAPADRRVRLRFYFSAQDRDRHLTTDPTSRAEGWA